MGQLTDTIFSKSLTNLTRISARDNILSEMLLNPTLIE